MIEQRALIHCCIAAIVWLWSTRIGDEDKPTPSDEVPLTVSPAKPGPIVPRGAQQRRASLPLRSFHGIDRQAFLAAFQRQASAPLTACLKAWESSPGSVAVTATLSRKGRVSHVAALDPARPLPECVTQLVEQMDFAALAARMPQDSVSLQWRIDW